MKKIPTLYNNIYTKTIDSSRVLYNPSFNKGITVVNGITLQVLDLINGKRTIEEIFEQLNKKNVVLTMSDVLAVFSMLVEYRIVYFEKPVISLAEVVKRGAVFSVWFHITNQCNLRCKYCYVWKSSEEMSKQVAETTMTNIIKSSQKVGYKTVHFNFAGGEPLLKINLIKHLITFAHDIAHKNNMEVTFGIVTNGTLITEKVAEYIKENNITLTVTLDGTQKYHDLQRVFTDGSGSYNYVIKAINLLKKHNVIFGINVVVTNNNMKDLPNFIGKLIRNEFKFRLLFLKENSYSEDNLTMNHKKLISYLKKTYTVVRKNIPRYKVISGLLDYVVLMPALLKCRAGRENITVDWKGVVSPCPLLMDRHIGNAINKDVVRKLKNPELVSVNEINECNTCRWKLVCGGGCASHTHNVFGTFARKTPYCDVYKALIPEIIDLEARRIIKYDN